MSSVPLVVRSTAVLLAAASFAVCHDAAARTIRVEVGSGSYPTSGEAWDVPEPALGGAASAAGTLPFAINFGNGNVTGFCLNANGVIGFTSSCATPTSDTITVLGATWLQDPAASRLFHTGSITYNTGHVARGAIPPDPLDAPAAVRFTWNEVVCGSCPNPDTYTFQAVIIDMGNGDFDLELNYNSDVPAGVGPAGFSLGAFGIDLPFPLSPSEDYDFQFRGGRLVTGTPVPEPGALALLAVAAFAAGMMRRRSA